MATRSIGRFAKAGVLLILLLSLAAPVAADQPGPRHGGRHRYIIVATRHQDFNRLRQDAEQAGGTVVQELPQADTLVVTSDEDVQAALEASSASATVVNDGVRSLVQPSFAQEMGLNAAPDRVRFDKGHGGGHGGVTPDPAFSLDGLMWNVDRIGAPRAWRTTTGDDTVLVGVADTGLDYTHSELATQVVQVVDLTDPTLCPDIYAGTPYELTDADWAAMYGGPADTDWFGHGSWIGGNIASALDGVGVNGIAPNVKLVSLKISEWCGYAYDSSILNAIYYAADNGIEIVSISFGGYLDRSDPEQDTIYNAYVEAVDYARDHGTVIVAAAGNEHVRVGTGGKVLSHGILAVPGDPGSYQDLYGLWETPGGIPGVVMVSATGNVTNGASRNCAPDTIGSPDDGEASCKPRSDTHQPFGVGRQDQLTYYSNYGPRVDVAAPGGARKFNLPNADRGGTGGYPYVDTDGYNAWEEFNITSNWALQIPCFYNLGPEFYENECYSNIQGTSMATPHVSAVLALIASSNHRARHHVDQLVEILKRSAQDVHGNRTPALSASDMSAGDRTGLDCTTGYCHLGGPAVSDSDAYGAGLVNASDAVRGRR